MIRNKNGYINDTAEPLYYFGHGLSYTEFTYSDLQTDKKNINPDDTVKVTFTVKNTGEYDGAEVAQLYFSDRVASMVRPTKELAGFVRIFLKKGEKKKVVFEIKVSQFAFLDEEMKWKVEKGEIELLAGSSCEDIRLSDIVSISEDDYIDGKTRGFYAKAVVC